MTAQKSEKFISRHSDFKVGVLRLYQINGYELKTKINKSEDCMKTSLRRGYIGTYELGRDGKLKLKMYSLYTGIQGKEYQDFNAHEELVGDFSLDFREQFFGKRLIVPFVKGTIVLDQERWHKEQAIRGETGLIDRLYPTVETKS